MLNTILDILLEAFIDSLKTLPVLFICYMLIELLEEKILRKYKKNSILKSRFAPVVSAGFGIIPQCGFSVVAADLYSKRAITIGSLFAILIATSDEALPIMLSNPSNYLNLLIILSVKFVYAIIVGLLLDLFFSKKKNANDIPIETKEEHIHNEVHGCCNHDLEHTRNSKLKTIFIHPLKHSLKIFVFILVLNIIFGSVVTFVGEDVIKSFMLSTGFFEPIIVSIVGLIPNCAASVIVTEMFLAGSISLGSCIAGLVVNSGLAIIMLFRLNKNIKENIAILCSMYFLGCLIGMVVNLF